MCAGIDDQVVHRRGPAVQAPLDTVGGSGNGAGRAREVEVDTIPSGLHDGEVYLYNGAGSTSRGWRTAMSGDVGWPDRVVSGTG